MKRRRRLFRLVGLVAVLGLPTVALAAGGVSWGSAIEVPGLAALNLGGVAEVNTLSCASPGNCAAGGSYMDGSGNLEAFVVDEKNGVWGDAIEVPGIAALNVAGYAGVTSVSCGSVGNCATGGYYSIGSNQYGGYYSEAYVVDEKNGVWGSANEVPGTAALNVGGPDGPAASVGPISCVGGGNCAAGGSYTDSLGHQKVFVVDETSGIWRTAKKLPVPGYFRWVGSISCASAGNCAVVGGAFVAEERRGVWGKAHTLLGMTSLHKVANAASTNAVSCSSPGNCAAGGSYQGSGGRDRAFVASEQQGVWRTAKKLPDPAGHSVGYYASVASISCASPGNCAAGGVNADRKALVIAEKGGVWGKPVAVVPGAPEDDSEVTSVSCASLGNCAAVGGYGGGAFVVSERKGVWRQWIQVPGTAAFDQGFLAPGPISCTKTGPCAISGVYLDAANNLQAFVTTP